MEVDGTSYNFALDAEHYGAFAATVAAMASFFWLRKYYKYSLGLIFALGFCGLISFTVIQTSIGIGFDEHRIGLSPLMLLFGLLVYVTNSRKINALLLALVKPSDEQINARRQEEIAEFKSKFSRKSTDDLKQILADNKLVPSAQTAARQLLQERSEAVTTQ